MKKANTKGLIGSLGAALSLGSLKMLNRYPMSHAFGKPIGNRYTKPHQGPQEMARQVRQMEKAKVKRGAKDAEMA